MEQDFRYDSASYPPFAVTVDVALFTLRGDRLRVLLVERAENPYKGSWALPGGFVRIDEDLAQAAARELAEETGVQGGHAHVQQLGTYGTPDRDPRMRVVTVVYLGIAAEIGAPVGGGDAAHAELKSVDAVECGEIRLAFDHQEILGDALERLRAKLEYTALAAMFCGPRFTIGELRSVYEAVWKKRLDPGNFQRGFRENPCFAPCDDPPANPASGRGRPATQWYLNVSAINRPVPLLAKPLARR